jgi:hypothetical protein
MSKDKWIGKKDARYYYYKYRDSEYFSLGWMALVVVVCLVLIFNIIIPQLTTWFSIRDEIVATRQRIDVLQQNIAFMNNLNKNELDSQLATATNVLPPEKDFGSMLNVLADASISSNVSLNDFSFQVGNVASSSAAAAPGAAAGTESRYRGLASIKITVVVAGTVDNIRRFIQTVEKSVPVSEIVNIDGSGQTISISVQFYQKSLPNIALQPDQKLQPLSADKVNLLQQLATWRKSQPVPDLSGEVGSASALPLF